MNKYQEARNEFNYMDSNNMKFEHLDNKSKKTILTALTRMAEIEEGNSVVVPIEVLESWIDYSFLSDNVQDDEYPNLREETRAMIGSKDHE